VSTSRIFTFNLAVFLAFLYAFLFWLTKELDLTSESVGLISYFFLPAFVRIIACFGPRLGAGFTQIRPAARRPI
jgi:hypothetical protein